MTKNYIYLDSRDNVAVAISDLDKGTLVQINANKIIIAEKIQQKHKAYQICQKIFWSVTSLSNLFP